MEQDFWLEKWQQSTEHGFHQESYHPFLEKLFTKLNLKSQARILVPLCGKSLDMIWLMEQGYQVIGVELSPIACESFFKENNLSFEINESSNFKIYKNDKITIYCGDLFDLNKENLPSFEGLYDRAALVALPLAMRAKYYQELKKLLSQNASGLIITFFDEQRGEQGPPFSIQTQEVVKYLESFSPKLAYHEETRLNQNGLPIQQNALIFGQTERP